MVCFRLLLVSCWVLVHGNLQGQRIADRYQPRQVLDTPMRAITHPSVVSAAAAVVPDNELVLGVEVNGMARAYRINELTGPRREIINDTLSGLPIAATW